MAQQEAAKRNDPGQQDSGVRLNKQFNPPRTPPSRIGKRYYVPENKGGSTPKTSQKRINSYDLGWHPGPMARNVPPTVKYTNRGPMSPRGEVLLTTKRGSRPTRATLTEKTRVANAAKKILSKPVKGS